MGRVVFSRGSQSLIKSGRPFYHRLHSGQESVASSEAQTRVVVAGRRSGKSELAIWLAILEAASWANRPPSVSWVVAPTHLMTRALWRKWFKLCPPGWVTKIRGTYLRPDFVELGNHRVEFRSADRPERLVSEGLVFLVLDEAGITKERVWFESLRPTLIDHGGRAVIIGTPKGRNWLYRLYLQGQDPAEHARVQSWRWSSWSNPFSIRTEIEKAKLDTPRRLFRQEYLAEFLSDAGGAFRGVRDAVARTAGAYSLRPTVSVGWDLGRREDFSVLVGMDEFANVTFYERWRGEPWPVQKTHVERVMEGCGNPLLIMDRTGVGDAVFEEMEGSGKCYVRGFVFTSRSKAALVDALALAFEKDIIGLPDEPVLVNEMEAFEYHKTATGRERFAAPEGQHDDCVMACGLALMGLDGAGDAGVSLL